jgi:hypothetical protein
MLIRKPADASDFTDLDDKENEFEGAHRGTRMESYISHGRTFGRNGNIFNSVNDVVQYGVKLAIADSDSDGEENVEGT